MGFIATVVKFATQTDPTLMSDLHGQFNPACARLYVYSLYPRLNDLWSIYRSLSYYAINECQ